MALLLSWTDITNDPGHLVNASISASHIEDLLDLFELLGDRLMAVTRDQDHGVDVLLESGDPVGLELAIDLGPLVTKIQGISQHACFEGAVTNVIIDAQLCLDCQQLSRHSSADKDVTDLGQSLLAED